ncbi:nuclear transport factor 2 family protein [Streptomyces avicenniae]|uniref:nuclear transport factor 2 family protein n=1 Tax=Streptomyces avicenniae TaxID=500153 RepID=UPI00069984F5|nr:nuclear transport factor 2 family protein [Streptomyces avicenniae]
MSGIRDTSATAPAHDPLADRLELTELTNRLGPWLDDKAFDEIASLYTADVVGEFPGGTVEGAAALAAQARRTHPADVVTHHLTANVVIALDGDEATVRANQTATFNVPGAPLEPAFAVGERYDLRAVRTPDGWRFARVRVHQAWRS